jgi:hypothetical protein
MTFASESDRVRKVMVVALSLFFMASTLALALSYRIEYLAPTLDITEHDPIITIPKNASIVKHSIAIRNTGNTQLAIRKVRSSCGCTEVRVLKSILAPGESTSLELTIDAGGVRSKDVYVVLDTNDLHPAHAIVRLLVKRDELAFVHPTSMDFGIVRRQELPATRLVRLHVFEPAGSVKVESSCASKYLAISVSPFEDNVAAVFISILPSAPAGRLEDTVKITASNGEFDLSVQVLAQIADEKLSGEGQKLTTQPGGR